MKLNTAATSAVIIVSFAVLLLAAPHKAKSEGTSLQVLKVAALAELRGGDIISTTCYDCKPEPGCTGSNNPCAFDNEAQCTAAGAVSTYYNAKSCQVTPGKSCTFNTKHCRDVITCRWDAEFGTCFGYSPTVVNIRNGC